MTAKRETTARAAKTGASRRDFFKVASGAAGLLGATVVGARDAAALKLPAPKASVKKFVGGKFPKGPVMAKGRVLGANDRITVGHIGVGGMGTSHLGHYKRLQQERNTRSLAVCDPYQIRLDKARAMLEGTTEGATIQVDKDYRRVLENKDIDAVMIAPPEHWHCQIAVHAIQAGKHVYVEKPLARYLDEAFQVYDAAKASDRIVQVGAHYTSNPKYHAAREVVASGKLGPIVNAQGSYTRNVKDGEWNYKIDPEAGPENLDWELWLGSAAKRPWNDDSKERFFRYRKFRDYSAGILGDLMPHQLHPLLLTLNTNDWPRRVTCHGTRNISTDREVPDTVHMMAEMTGGWNLLWIGSTVNEQGLQEMIRGNKATLYLAGAEPEVKPERPYSEEIEGGVVPVKDSGENHVKHQNNWLASIRENKQPNCNMELAIRAQAIISLAEISEMSGRSVMFDPQKRTWKFV